MNTYKLVNKAILLYDRSVVVRHPMLSKVIKHRQGLIKRVGKIETDSLNRIRNGTKYRKKIPGKAYFVALLEFKRDYIDKNKQTQFSPA